MHRKAAIWFFTCDGCHKTYEVVLRFCDSMMTHPPGWRDDIYATNNTNYNPQADYCPECIEKKEIREVFK